MINILLEITTKCMNCGDTIAINAAVNKIWCSHCKGHTTFSNELWSLLLGEIMSMSNEMHFGEAGRTSIEDESSGTVRITFKITNPVCYNCKQNISYNDNVNDKITCSNCGTAILKRPVPQALINKNVNFFLDEDSYQIEEENENSYIVKPVDLSCTHCGAPLKADGKDRLISCTFCNTEIMLPDTIWHRLHPSEHIRQWYFVYAGDKDKKLKPWSFGEIDGICCDEEQILYCIGETRKGANSLWAMTPQCELKWMTLIPQDKRWPRYFSNIELLADGNLLIWDREVHPGLVYDKRNGDFIKELGGIEPAGSKIHTLDFYYFSSFAADPDGSMVGLINSRILRFSKEGKGIYLWPKTFLDSQKLQPIYIKNGNESKPEMRMFRDGGLVLPHKLKNKTNIYSYLSEGYNSVHIGKDGSLYILAPFKGNAQHEILGGAILTKFNRKGKIIYKADLKAYSTNQFKIKTDNNGYTFIVLNDSREDFAGKIIRVSPDGSEIKIIIKTSSSAVHDSSFAVGGDGTIYLVSMKNQLRIYNREGELIWRNTAALEFDKKSIEDEK